VKAQSKRGALLRTQTIILRAAGGIFLAGGLCVCAMPSAFAAQSSSQPATARSTGKKPSSTKSTSAKSAAPVKSTSASQTKKTTTPVKSSSSAKSTRKKSATTRTAKTKMQTAPTPDRIKEIQSALAASDSYQGEPTGKWDDPSVAALKHFQQVNGLNPSGKLDALSLQKLGLGSDTAGRGAPRPAKPPTTPTTSTTPSTQR
jgi:hypothetical protein